MAGAVVLALGATHVRAAPDLEEARALAAAGKYEEALEQATQAVTDRLYGDTWHILKADMELALGRYADARATIEAALERYSWSIRLRWRLRTAARFTGDTELAAAQTDEIARLVDSSPWRFTDADNLITLGEIALAMGADAKDVQDAFFQRAKRNNPLRPEPQIALGMLALDKRDEKLAADTFRTAAEKFPDNADIQYGLAAALTSADSAAAEAALTRVFELNPNHVPGLLRQADNLIDGEQYDDAEFMLNRILSINPVHPQALAYWSALAHLRSDPESEKSLREQALATWAANPEVDFIIGRELSQKYRFAEGAVHQRQALALDPEYLPARKQLAEDLLRLGDEDEGWELADAAFAADGYDTAIYNLLNLRDELRKYETIEDEQFIVRMAAHEATVYGPRVLDLLHRARVTLCEKYGLEREGKVIVEIFDKPDDFAVRTFGMPGVMGYLGVCFGNVITANSPAAQLNPSSWEAVLWHEFAHVVTLNLTKNKMPRWLSEGISVYEERQANPSWGEHLNPAYRELIMNGELTPIGELSSAFLSPKSALHVQFAYFESSLVVEYVIDKFGFESLTAILHDLGEGVYINDAIERHAAPLAELETAFANYVTEQTESLAPEADWSNPDLEELLRGGNAEADLRQWIAEHPDNIRALTALSMLLIQLERWEDAKPVLRRIIELYPDETGADCAAMRLATVHRKLGESEAEREVLARYAALDADGAAAFLRLIEIETAREDWEAVRTSALRMLAVNPLIPQPHRALAAAARKLSQPEEEMAAYTALLALQPDDPADLHYQLAQLWETRGDRALAKRHVLLALESAPRYQAAQALLLKLVRSGEAPQQPEQPEIRE
jgi:tetratricopeptide (TPR) repeat protein